MFCCVGLFVGFYVGSVLGGPWTVIAPAVGFGLGLLGDMKLVRGGHGSHEGFGGGCCGGHVPHETHEKDTKDPVCGMEVNKKTTQYTAEFKGETLLLLLSEMHVYVQE